MIIYIFANYFASQSIKMEAKDQMKEVNQVLDRLTKFRHFNGWAAVAAGIMGIIGFVFISFVANFPIIIPSDFTWLNGKMIMMLVLSFAGLMMITGIICAAIIVFSLPSDLTRYGWNNLRKLVGTLILYILAGSATAWVLLHGLLHGIPYGPMAIKFMPAMMCLLYGLALLHISIFSEPILKKLGLFIFVCGIAGTIFAPYSWLLWLAAFGFGHLITGYVLIRDKNLE